MAFLARGMVGKVWRHLNVLHPTERESLYFWLSMDHPKRVGHDEYKGKPM